MSYKDWFRAHNDSGDRRIFIYISRPSSLNSSQRIADTDKSACRYIEELKETISELEEYRKDLAERYAALEVMPYRRVLSIIRKRAYKGNVTFTVKIKKIYSDCTQLDELSETFTGKEKKAALARFEELAKAYPGIETVKDLEKKNWEK